MVIRLLRRIWRYVRVWLKDSRQEGAVVSSAAERESDESLRQLHHRLASSSSSSPTTRIFWGISQSAVGPATLAAKATAKFGGRGMRAYGQRFFGQRLLETVAMELRAGSRVMIVARSLSAKEPSPSGYLRMGIQSHSKMKFAL